MLPVTFLQQESAVVLKDIQRIMAALDVGNFFPADLGKKKDYSGFDRSQWQPSTYEAHMDAVKKILRCTTQNAIERGIRN